MELNVQDLHRKPPQKIWSGFDLAPCLLDARLTFQLADKSSAAITCTLKKSTLIFLILLLPLASLAQRPVVEELKIEFTVFSNMSNCLKYSKPKFLNMFFSSQTMAMSIALVPNGDFNGLLKQKEGFLDIEGLWSINSSGVIDLSFIVSWKDRGNHLHLTAFAGSIEKDNNNNNMLTINWISINDNRNDVNGDFKNGSALLSEKSRILTDEEQLHNSNNPFENHDFVSNQPVIRSEFVSRLTGIDWNVATLEINPQFNG